MNPFDEIISQRNEAIKILILVLESWKDGESINESRIYKIAQKHIENYIDSLDN